MLGRSQVRILRTQVLATTVCYLFICRAAAQPLKMVQIDDSFDGRSIAVHTGDVIEITLAENASTGYRWTLPPTSTSGWSPTLRQIEQTVETQSTRPGMPGVRRLYFEAAAAGDAELELEYRRSWETSAKPARTFRLRIKIRLP
jgi:predicted secreted protein